MTRFALALLAATAFGTSACAENAPTSSAEAAAQTSTTAATTAATTGETIQNIDPGKIAVAGFEAPEADWRTPDPENTVYVDTVHGRMIIELYPEVAPEHVKRVKTLASSGFYDGLKFHRVLKGFMNQTGDPLGDGTGDSGLPDLPAEFTFRRGTDMPVTMLGAQRAKSGELATGFYKALPIATQPSSQAILTKDGKVNAYGLHCVGVLSAARSSDPNSANSQFFLMRDAAPFLDAQYTVWGKVIAGNHILKKITVTHDDQDKPIPGVKKDEMTKVQMATQIEGSAMVPVKVLRTDSESFAKHVESLKSGDRYPNICDIDVPSRLN